MVGLNQIKLLLLCISASAIHSEVTDEPGPKSSRWQREAFVRIHDEGEWKNVVLAEQERLVHVVLNAGSMIVDCQAGRRKYEVLENLMAEVEAFEETGEFPFDVDFVELETDVGWYGRQCRKKIRDQVRSIELGESLLSEGQQEELRDRLWISKGLQGTNFCSRQLPRQQLIAENLGEKQELDRCCLGLYSCSEPLTPLEYRHSLLNPSLFPLFPCPCLSTFFSCLSLAQESEEEARRLERVWKTYGGHCYNMETKTRCTEYNTWFTECVEGNSTEVAIRTRL